MPAEIQYHITGDKEVIGIFREIKDDVKYKGGRFATRKAAQLVEQAAKINARRIDDPNTPQSIAENIVIRFSPRTFKATGDILFRIGMLGGARKYANTKENRRKGRAGQTYSTLGDTGNPGGDTWYWRLVEFGTEHSTARKFFEKALPDNVARATDEFVRQYQKALDRAIKRAKKAQQ